MAAHYATITLTTSISTCTLASDM